jgi:hypothetical protein
MMSARTRSCSVASSSDHSEMSPAAAASTTLRTRAAGQIVRQPEAPGVEADHRDVVERGDVRVIAPVPHGLDRASGLGLEHGLDPCEVAAVQRLAPLHLAHQS